jgi:hypothetical protein
MNLTTEHLLAHFKTVPAVADFFDVSVQSVYYWFRKGAIPRDRQYELKERLPEVFGQFQVSPHYTKAKEAA